LNGYLSIRSVLVGYNNVEHPKKAPQKGTFTYQKTPLLPSPPVAHRRQRRTSAIFFRFFYIPLSVLTPVLQIGGQEGRQEAPNRYQTIYPLLTVSVPPEPSLKNEFAPTPPPAAFLMVGKLRTTLVDDQHPFVFHRPVAICSISPSFPDAERGENNILQTAPIGFLWLRAVNNSM
jgi:hypothetical protein